MKKILIAFAILLAASIGIAETLFEKFDSKNHPKAKGAWFTVKYPASWESKDGERPNIVKKFSGDYKGYFTQLMVQVKKADGPIEIECKSTSAIEMAKIMTDGDPEVKISNAKKISHENKPAFLFDMHQKIERAGNAVGISNRIMTVCQKDKLIMLWCGNMKIDKAANRISSSFQDLEIAGPVCFQFFNSLVLMDNY
jgi:hypothetical protein